MTDHLCTYWPQGNLWFLYEIDEDAWPLRHVEVENESGRVVTAASRTEVLYLRDHGHEGAMRKYEKRFGHLADAPLGNWRSRPYTKEIPASEFEQAWITAREIMDQAWYGADAETEACMEKAMSFAAIMHTIRNHTPAERILMAARTEVELAQFMIDVQDPEPDDTGL